MKRIALAAAAFGVIAVPAAQAQAPAVAAAPYEIVHVGDSQMSCEAVAKEVAALNAESVQIKAAAEQKQAQAAQAGAGGRIARGLGGALFSQAAAMGIGHLPMGTLINNPMLVNGLARAAQAGGSAIANGGASAAQAATPVSTGPLGQEQRAAYLMSLFKSKSC